MIGRILRPADFQRVLAAPQRSRSPHFAVHHVADAPSRPRATVAAAEVSSAKSPVIPELTPDLSTDLQGLEVLPVDESGRWLGLVVPKRHAKRAVTRNLIKRQLRAAMAQHAPGLPAGLWVVRLRAPFDRSDFRSPASDVLRDAARVEIDALFDRAARSPLPPSAPRPPRTSGRTRR